MGTFDRRGVQQIEDVVLCFKNCMGSVSLRLDSKENSKLIDHLYDCYPFNRTRERRSIKHLLVW